ncbi:MAG: hypothetical protein J7M26_03415 [Armatimonadetes bacterium]|nr:hypothetical protein [Armatimonadota bacterium]
MLLDGPLGPEGAATVTLRAPKGVVKVSRWGPVNTGAPEVLRRFAAETRRSLPAQWWMLVLLGHGEPAQVPAGKAVGLAWYTGGLGEDWGAGGDGLTPAELSRALEGQRWDVVVVSACYSGSAEVAWALAGKARWLVGSPGRVSSTGEGLVRALRALAKSKGEVCAREVALRVAKEMGEEAATGEEVVISDLTRMGQVEEALRELCDGLLGMPESVGRSALAAARAEVVQAPSEGPMVDLAGFADALGKVLPPGKAREAANALARAAREATLVVRHGGSEEAVRGGEGITLFWPPPMSGPWDKYERTAPLARVTGWGKVLRELWMEAGGAY